MIRRTRGCSIALITATMLLTISPTLFSSTRSQTHSLDDQALAQAKQFFSKMSIRCGQYYYYTYREQIAVMYQCKYAPTISVEGRAIQPRRLSEADRLNGVDPLPIAWQGRAVINLGLCRRQVPGPHGPGSDAWERWLDRNSDAVGLINRKGQWEFANQPTGRELYTVKTVLPITCKDVPDPSRKSAPTPPSWRGRHYNGGQILRLHATYDRWFYMGRGPMTLKLPSTYSQITIDGTNNIRTPLGGAMYLGAKTTDPGALAPNIKLGAVIVKIGNDEEPIQPFTESMSPVNDGFHIRSNEEIFIAINDSYFADNRGAHVVIVEGGDLNFGSGDRLPSPRLLSPEDGAFMHHYPRTTIVKWEPVVGASSYTVEIQMAMGPIGQETDSWYDLAEHHKNFPASTFVPPVKIKSTSFTFDWVGENMGRWRVWAIDDQGNEGLKSKWRYFKYTL